MPLGSEFQPCRARRTGPAHLLPGTVVSCVMILARRIRMLLAALAMAMAPCAHHAAHAADVLRIGVNVGYHPFGYLDDRGRLAGFDIDIARALCAAMDADCRLTVIDWEDNVTELLANRVDAVVASMSITEERKRLVAFTNRYYRTPMQFVARRGFDRPITRESLRGLKVGVASDTTAERYMRQAFGSDVELVLDPDQGKLNRALAAGELDLVLADSLAMWIVTKSDFGKDFEFVGHPVYVDEDIGIAVRKQDAALRQRLNQAIARIRIDGTYQKINAKYFPFGIY